jgi:hypothetical protein
LLRESAVRGEAEARHEQACDPAGHGDHLSIVATLLSR